MAEKTGRNGDGKRRKCEGINNLWIAEAIRSFSPRSRRST